MYVTLPLTHSYFLGVYGFGERIKGGRKRDVGV